MSFCKFVHPSVNAEKYRTTIKFHDIQFIKMDTIWNQLFQIIEKMGLSRIVWLGKTITA